MVTLTWATAALLLLSPIATAEIIQGRQNAQARALSTTYPTVPSFTQASITYDSFSKVYPSGYTVPSGATNTATVSPAATEGGGNAGGRTGDPGAEYEAEVSSAKYLQSMCAPTITSSMSAASTGVEFFMDLRYPCNLIKNIGDTCHLGMYPKYGDNSPSPKAQQKCLCPGGPGAAIWENTEACNECERLHGASASTGNGSSAFFIPVQYVKDISSAYCGIKTASLDFQKFAANFSKTHTASYGTVTGGVDLLKGKTAVSNYFTSTTSRANSTGHIVSTGSFRNPAGSTSSVPARTAAGTKTNTSPSASKSTSGAGRLMCSGLLGAGMWGVACVINSPIGGPSLTKYWPLTQLLGASTRPHIRHQALFPSGSKAFTVTTSSYKKRRLSPPESLDTQESSLTHSTHGDSSPVSQPTQPLSPPHLSLRNRSQGPASSPPRFIPQHLVLGSAARHRSPTPEITNTAASSPSALYAGLALDTESSGDTSSGDGRAASNGREPLAGRDSGGGLSYDRSSSPATKRPASEMEDTKETAAGNAGEGKSRSVSTSKAGLTTTTNIRRSSLGNSSRHKREVSVDMIANEAGPSSENTQLAPVPEHRPGLLLSGAYQTPESGTSISGSSIGGQEASDLSSTVPQDIPPIDEQIINVRQLCNKELEEGQQGYVVSMKWLARVLSRGSDVDEARKYGKEAREGPIGPVDNSGLNVVVDPTLSDLRDEKGDKYVPLRPGLQFAEDCEILPKPAWDLIVKWYGIAKGSAIIPRYCHNTSSNEFQPNMQYELYPPIFTVLLLLDQHSEGFIEWFTIGQPKRPVKIMASRHESFHDFLRRLKDSVALHYTTKVRIWKVFGGLGESGRSGMLTPAQSRSNSPAPGIMPTVDAGQSLILDVDTFMRLELGSQREKLDTDDQTANENYNGHATMDLVGLRGDDVLVLEERVRGPAGGEWVSGAPNLASKPNKVPISVTKNGTTTVKDSLKPTMNTGSGRSSPAPTSGIMTRGRSQKNGKTRGTVGLGNLGNTCYMNSALQCIRSVEELTQYFLMKKFKSELNPDNPLGHHGAVANAYANLLGEIYNVSATSSFTPRQFKNTISRYGPAFSGYGQQDSQEFLLFLLDGLQEDLNRIKKKPYIEKPDSTDEMVKDPAALRAMADRCWDIYKLRNDSVITDLFAGMYKSTVTCPVCSKVSIIFDPFNNLTLQLPIETVWSHPVWFIPLRSLPFILHIEIDKNASFMALKEYVAKKVGSDAKKLLAVEIYRSKLYKIFDDKTIISNENIQTADDLAIYEVEYPLSEYAAPRKKQKKPVSMSSYEDGDENDKMASTDKILLTVLQRILKKETSRFARGDRYQPVALPFCISVTAEEAQDYGAIWRKVLMSVDQHTTSNYFRENEEPETEADMVLMNAGDGDSASESKIHTSSVGSDDGMINISMREADEEPSIEITSQLSGMPKAKPLPHMLRPGASIPNEVSELFEMKYFSTQGDMIPSGLQNPSDNEEYKKLSSRAPSAIADRKLTNSDKIKRHLENRSNQGSSDEDAAVQPEPTIVQNDDSDSDGLPEVEQLIQPPANSNSRSIDQTGPRSKPLITYSRKDKRTPIDGQAQLSEPTGPVINLGEGIILEWAPQAFDSFFDGDFRDPEEMRGVAIWHNMVTLQDPGQERRKKIRDKRRRDGVTLEDCLDEFGKSETLAENDAWYCPRCKEHRRATKTFELWKCPDILVIHLKRFSNQSRSRDKLDILVDFPVENLDLSSRVSIQEEGKDSAYDLFAVDNHYGGLGGGHYTAFAKNFDNDKWSEYNDTVVRELSDPDRVITSAAYLLFYRRRSSGPLGGPFFEQLLTNTENGGSESQPTSRAASPPGEGRRLDDSSRIGSSSAFHEAGAAHQAGGGGLIETAAQRTGVDDDLPAYSSALDQHDSMELDEGIGMAEMTYIRPSAERQSSWEFGDDIGVRPYSQVTAAPPGSDEDLFEGDGGKSSPSSTRAARSGPPSEDGRDHIMHFMDDEGITSGALGTPEERFVSLEEEQDDADATVMNIPVPSDHEDERLDR